ncbi:MAG: 1-deoxy-D-xylulose-5-phosphate reductoisomerase [Acidobacteriota bacterium]
MKRLAILGSTGSIGQSALSLVDMFPDRFRVATLAANAKIDLLCQQALKYRPEMVALYDESSSRTLAERLPGIRVASGAQGVKEAAIHERVDAVVSAISGGAGLIPTWNAILAGKDVALANKETLVMAGDLVMRTVSSRHVKLLPVDSEHSALHQCLRGASQDEVKMLVLTASGGPFFRYSREQLKTVTVEQALNHPTWRMGRKITVDSATLMNKGLEVIEAHHLFGVGPEQIAVVIHPQSTVHSMVEFVDGTVLAQMSVPDMRSAILYALTHPERWPSPLPGLDFSRLGPLEFHPPDHTLFPCLRMAWQALAKGRTYPAAMNAANEVAVEWFLKGRLSFNGIPQVIEEVLSRHKPVEPDRLDDVLEADRDARKAALAAVEKFSNS